MSESTSPESPTARGLDRRALDYSASIAFDRRLYAHDIDLSAYPMTSGFLVGFYYYYLMDSPSDQWHIDDVELGALTP
ncbi:MAG: hypothetical protein ACE1ZN_04430, partial [Dehalococcoidia bacterium]